MGEGGVCIQEEEDLQPGRGVCIQGVLGRPPTRKQSCNVFTPTCMFTGGGVCIWRVCLREGDLHPGGLPLGHLHPGEGSASRVEGGCIQRG